MFNNNVPIVVGSTTTNYALIKNEVSGTTRRNGAAPLTEPDELILSHEERGKGTSALGRHLCKIATTVSATDASGITRSAIVNAYIVIAFPRSGIVTSEDAVAAFDKVVAFLNAEETSGTRNVVRFIQGEP